MNWNFIFREGLRGLGRNFTMTIALIITTALSLVLVGAGILISQATSATKDLYLDRVEVMVELDETISAIAPIDAIRDMPQVAMVSDQADTVREAAGTMDTFRNVTFVVAAAQALASLFLIVNMVQLAAYNRREQIAIMRMVGASRWFTQAPFVLEAVLSVLIGAVLATVLAWVGKRSLVDPILGDLYASQLVARVPDSAVMTVMPLVGLGAVVIGALAAQVALRSYVRK